MEEPSLSHPRDMAGTYILIQSSKQLRRKVFLAGIKTYTDHLTSPEASLDFLEPERQLAIGRWQMAEEAADELAGDTELF